MPNFYYIYENYFRQHPHRQLYSPNIQPSFCILFTKLQEVLVSLFILKNKRPALPLRKAGRHTEGGLARKPDAAKHGGERVAHDDRHTSEHRHEKHVQPCVGEHVVARSEELKERRPSSACFSFPLNLSFYLFRYSAETGKLKYVSGYGSYFSAKCHHSQSIG